MKKTYIISPYAGKIKKNKKNATEYCKFAISQDYLPFAAHLYFTQFTRDNVPTERKQGLEMGLEMLKICDEAWVFYNNYISAGMAGEIRKAKDLNIPIRCFKCKKERILHEFSVDELRFKYNTIQYIDLSLIPTSEQKGYSHKNISSFVVLDLETTGLDPEKNEIINIGAIRYQNDKPIAEFNVLVKPENEIPEEITRLTGITNEMVKDKPSIKDVLPSVLDFIGNDIVLCHNAEFDLSFLNYNLEIYRQKQFIKTYIDTLLIARSFRQNNKLENLIKEYIKPEYTQKHLALSDAKYTAELFKIFKKMNLQPKPTD